jgi:uracil-DNA glycosylase family protein
MTDEAARSAAEFLPEQTDLEHLRSAARHCRGCDLYQNATQTVFGAGAPGARVVLVGEQPGDQEDQNGQPFVGPSGELLSQALEEVGLPREELYVTNAVKHFKWEPRGKRRIHKRPNMGEVRACGPWLSAELRAVRPEFIVCLGVTAASAVFGKTVRLKDYRSTFTASPDGLSTFVTTHPSSLLRLRGREGWELEYQRFVRDFERVAQRLDGKAHQARAQ